MNPWQKEKWKDVLDYPNHQYRHGLRLRFDKGVDPVLKEECKKFAVWLRREYFFPIRVPIYFKNKIKLLCMDGDTAYGTCFLPYSYQDEPYIRIAVGDFDTLRMNRGEKDAVLSIIHSIAHELTHYFQWINNEQLTPIGEEHQSTRCANYITEQYIDYLYKSE